MRARVLNRKLHRIGAMLVALPFLVIILTGILLQLKKEVAWIQPETRQGVSASSDGGSAGPEISFTEVLRVVREVPEAEIENWDDILRLDVRPNKGMLKVRAKNGWEVQLDTKTGAILQVAVRRSDFIESIHDGSILFDSAKLALVLPVAVILLGLLGTGTYLFFLPQISRRRRDRRRTTSAQRALD